jgi:hypothetical protein
LTAEGAPVDVSLLALATASGSSGQTDFGSQQSKYAAVGLGAELGLAVERELRDGLSLRVATPLVGLAWDWQRVENAGAAPVRVDYLRADIALAPRLELRMAF